MAARPGEEGSILITKALLPPPPPCPYLPLLLLRDLFVVGAKLSGPPDRIQPRLTFSFRQKGFYELCGYGPFFLPHAQNKRAAFPYRLSRGGGAFLPTWHPHPPLNNRMPRTAEKGKRSILFGMCRMHSSSLGVGATQLRTVPLFGWVGGYLFSRYRTFKISDAMQMCAIVPNKKRLFACAEGFSTVRHLRGKGHCFQEKTLIQKNEQTLSN